jgi:hypothetical protein
MATFPVRAGVITNPLGAAQPYSNVLRTWTQSRAALQGRDVMATGFRKEAYDLPPRQVPFIPDYTFANPIAFKLIGKDTMTVAFRKEVYDLAPGQVPALQPDLRTWTQQWSAIRLGGPSPGGPGVQSLALPASPYRIDQTWIKTPQQAVPTAPFGQDDWPLPRSYPRLDQTWIKTPIIVAVGPLPSYDLQLPPSMVGTQVPSWMQSLLPVEAVNVPFSQDDWPLPRASPRPDETWAAWYNLNLIGQDRLPTGKQVFDRTPIGYPPQVPSWAAFIFDLEVQIPVGEHFYDRTPTGYPPQVPSWAFSYELNLIGKDQLPTGKQVSDRPSPVIWFRDWSINLNETTLAPAARAPFAQYDWPLFRSYPRLDQTWIETPVITTVGPLSSNDWQVPPSMVAPLLPVFVSAGLQSAAVTVVAAPFNQDDWPLPQVQPRRDQTWAFSYGLNLIGQDKLPTGEQFSDRPQPPPWYRDWTLDLQLSTLFAGTPTAQRDWPLPQAQPRRDQTWTFSYDLNLIGKDQLPTGEQFSERPPPVNWYRDWALNLQETTLFVITTPIGENFSERPPIGFPPQVPSWTFSYDLNLIGKDQLLVGEQVYDRPQPPPWYRDWALDLQLTTLSAGTPTAQRDWPLPRTWPRLDQTWSFSYDLNLIGKDRLPTGEQVSDRPPPVNWYRDWSVNLQLTPFTTTVQFPPGELVFDRPPVPPWYRDWSQNLQEIMPVVTYMPSRVVEHTTPTPYSRLEQTWIQFPIKIATVVPPVGSFIYLPPSGNVPLFETWEWRYNLNLIGKDQLPVGEFFSERPPPVNWLRDWSLNFVIYNFTSVHPVGSMSSELYPRSYPPLVPNWTFSYDLNLIGKDKLPSGQRFYDLARGPSPLLQTWLFFEPPAYNPGVTQLPHIQYDWPLPKAYPPQVPSWAFSYDLNLIGKDQLPTGEVFSERPPPVNWYRDWAQFNLNAAATVENPLLPGDWQVPPSMVGVHALGWTFNDTAFSVVVFPPGELVFDRPPRGFPPQVPSWTFSYDLNLIGKDRLPTGQRSFDTPAQKERLPDLRNWYWSNVRVIGKDTRLTGQASFDTPAQKARLPDLTNWYWSYNLRLIGKDKLPSGQRLYEIAPRGPSPQVQHWSFVAQIHTLVKPLNQYDWPLPQSQPLFSRISAFANRSVFVFPTVLPDLTLIANQELGYFGIHDTYSTSISQIFLLLDYPAQVNPEMIFERPDGSTFIEQFPYVSVGQFTMNTPKGLAVAGHYLVYNVVKDRFVYPGVWRAFAVTDGPGATFYVRNY